MSSDRDKQAHLESLLTRSESEINLLESAMKKLKQEYDQNLITLSQKLREYEAKESEFLEFRKSSTQKNQEMELLKAKNEKLEERIKTILSDESAKLSQALTRVEALEQKNLELHSANIAIEERMKELNSQIANYKNLNEAHEKYQVMAKRNISKMEEQIEKLTNELSETRKKSVGEIAAKNQEISLMRLKIEESGNNIEVLKQQLSQKDELIRELGSNKSLEDMRNRLRELESGLQMKQRELEEKNSQLSQLQEAYSAEKEQNGRKIEEYEYTIAQMKKSGDELAGSLKEAQLESQKMRMELENEKARRDSMENFNISMLHKDRMIELSKKIIETEKKYHLTVEENKRLRSDLIRIKNEKNVKTNEMLKGQQEEAKDNFSLLISKLQLAINKNKSLNDEQTVLKKDIEARDKEINHLNEEIERLVSKIRNLTVENNKIKAKIYSLEGITGLEVLSMEQIESIKDEEIKGLREKIKTLNNELQNITKNSVNSQTLEQLKNDYEILKKEIHARNEMIDNLNEQLKFMREANALASMVSSSSAAGHVQASGEGMHVEQDEDFSKQVNELVQKRFEFENARKKLTEENEKLKAENKDLSKKVSNLQLKLKLAEKQNADHVSKVGMLEKERNIKADVVVNRERQISELNVELKRLQDERDQLLGKVGELEETREKFTERMRFYEEYTKEMNQINSEIFGDKELYLKTILHQKNEVEQIERKYEEKIEKLIKEREELRAEFVKANSERINMVKQHNEASIGNRLKLENQSIIITNFLKKVAYLEGVINDLERQLSQYVLSNMNNTDKSVPKLSDINELLDRSRLSMEDLKNFESLRELILQHKTAYEESVKFLEGTIETLSQKYFALEETYLSEKRSAQEQIDKLRRDNLETSSKYEQRLREQEEKARAREKELKAQKAKAQASEEKEETAGMEVEGEVAAGGMEDRGMPDDLLERDDMEDEIENLKRQLSAEADSKQKLKAELELERERIARDEEERTRLLKMTSDLDAEKANLLKTYRMREMSWLQQKRQYMQQIEEFRREENKRIEKLRNLEEQVHSHMEEKKKEEEEGEEGQEGKEEEEGKEQEMKEEVVKDTEKQGSREEYKKLQEDYEKLKESHTVTEEERDKLRQELDEMRLKVALLEKPEGMEGQMEKEDTEIMTTEEENEIIQELKKDLDSGSLLRVLERARSLLLAMSHKTST